MASRSAVAKRPSYLLSTLAETAEEYIKLECARRRNQVAIRRRSSLLEQYNVHVPTSRLKERQTQSRHHEFLVRKDNKAPIDVIIDRVRELAELYSSTRSGSSPSLSPMEKARFVAWADGVEKVLHEFEPSENHNLDPIVRMLEKLQFLQDGHVCLAEVAVDARMLLEKWERDGIFDTSDRDDDEADDDEAGAPVGSAERESDDQFEQRSVTWQRDRHQGTQLQHSYPYETIRQRAAANVIKRNVLRWVRLQESFQDRVDELQFFGKTTNSLMKELTSTANMRRPTAEQPSDIFDLVKVKRDGMYAHSIGFLDLMNFSKYVALFPVDQAIRTVEELEKKRFLYKNRCALKLQTIWRKARKAFQARRMRKLVEELRLQREKQEREEKERLALLSKSSTPIVVVMSDEKRKSVLSSSKKNRAVSLSTPPSTGSSRTSTRGGEASLTESQPVTPQSPRQRASVSGAKRKESKPRTTTTGGESQERKPRLSKVKSIHARERSRFDEDDNDTKDVENAWQSFLDSTVDLESDAIPITELASDPMPGTGGGDQLQTDGVIMSADVAMPPSFDDDDDWKNWSDGDENGALRNTDDDDEADLKAEEKIAHQLSLAASTALPVTPDASEISIEDQSELYHSRRLRNETSMAANLQEQRRHSSVARASTPLLAPPDEPPLQSSYGFQLDDDADRFRVKKTRVGKLSIMAPFAEFEQVNQSQDGVKRAKPPKAAEKKHLHEMDYGSVARSNLALLQLADPLVATDENGGDGGRDDDDVDDDLSHEAVRSVNMRVRHKTSARKRRVDIIKHSIAARETTPESITYRVRRPQQQRASIGKDVGGNGVLEPAESSEKAKESSEELVERFSYPIQKLDFRREVVMRRASQHNAEPTSNLGQPVISSESNSSSRVVVKKFGTQVEWLRSMGLDPTIRKSPRPPPSRLRTPQRPGDSKTPGSTGGDEATLSGVNNRQQAVKTRKRPKRFLPTLKRPTDEIKARTAIPDDSLDWEADVPARLPTLRNSSSRQEKKNGPQDHASSSNAASSRESSAHQTSSRDNGTVGGLNTENHRLETGESGSSSELSSDDSGGDVASRSDWSEGDASELEETHVGERTAESRDAGVTHVRREEVLLEEEAEDEAVATDESGQRGLKSSPRARVRVRVETNKVQQRSFPQNSTRARNRKTKRRHREPEDGGELDQDEDECLELSSDDPDTVNSIDATIDSDFRLSSSQSGGKTNALARRAPRSHHQTSRADTAFEDEIREAEAISGTFTTAATTKKRERESSARHASFQRLMMQYLGLLQCSPPVAMLPVGSG